ncbi:MULTISPECIES: dihydroxyacetone kinase subunit DhaL [unclassified Mesorhizobium]|uniref:dihydroxyacetone kinase subunit DhaL n=1 Tax=unclassified Mesorhizobium TaxID=325217 RepID=UPI000FCBBAD1|nr:MULTISPECIES: dihydroxyacetone kinase subunit DhaL [unclassified Mesorhizobium]RUX08904.1 dihydroxyacetone kinase subunit L [Mesorhizobium sp. M8A.F.Ca.ET.059.01.1.1]RVD45671.1 dihydroxyacetone kinase subunit L [Mesorhizobium sp. M8A.F.Ca.ET.023.02.2.1]TGU94185.1 dihydroxyacetone kinase subunit L [Mesorhizobium sp. M00.F.Ca.ET.151.01.1.1]TGV56619.1 dihydroxyacetone kinase subunit L [bacterium M00.F.Ca.ET.141.01.1.1]RUW55672.1 dihydroxyacetone kinase subunit L [Mesorhizobium sp. M8A.F.Ca.ET.
MTIGASDLKRMFDAIAVAIEADRDRLCQLDGVIGDADHGIAMALGFNAVRDALASLDLAATEPTALLNTAAKSFLNAVGASCGPLYATAFMRAAVAVKGKATLADAEFIALLQAMAQGIKDRGKAEIGEKTMVDAWQPAAEAAGASNAGGKSLADSLQAALAAAERGAESTKDMIAAKGRSSRLGERSLGHMDPGAASAVTVIGAMTRSLA